MRTVTLLAAVLPAGVIALPGPAGLAERQLLGNVVNNAICIPYNILINTLLVDPALVPFCGRYVKLPSTTVTRAAGAPVTVTSAVTLPPVGATTISSTTVLTVPAVAPSSITVTVTSTLTTFSGTTTATCLTAAYTAPARGGRKRAPDIGERAEDKDSLVGRQLGINLGGLSGSLTGGTAGGLIGGLNPLNPAGGGALGGTTSPGGVKPPTGATSPVPINPAPNNGGVVLGPISGGVGVGTLPVNGGAAPAPGGIGATLSVPRPSGLPVSIPDVSVSIICSCAPLTSTVTVGGAGASTVTATNTIVATSRGATTTSVRTITYTAPRGNPLTVTSTLTSTVAALATNIVPSGNGLPYKEYDSPFNAYLKDSGFSANYYKSRTPNWSGVWNSLNYATPYWPSMDVAFTLQLDRPQPWDASQAALLFQGFFVAPQSGTFTFTVPSAGNDNFAELWMGPLAYAWTDQTANFKSIRGATTTSTDAVFSITMNAGDAQPLTYLWANGGGAGRSSFSIMLPDGTQPTDISRLFVPPCNGNVFSG